MSQLAAPPLTALTCAICDEVKESHVVTDCSKPISAHGHEPVVCLQCFQATVHTCTTRPVPCPMCRAPATMYRQYRTEELRQPDANFEGTRRWVAHHSVPPLPDSEDELTHRIINITVTRPAQQQYRPRNQPRQTQHQPANNTVLGIFRQQVLRREGIDLNHMPNYRAELDTIHQDMLKDSFRTFASYRIYQRLLVTMHCSSPPCALIVPELLEHARDLAPNGLCKSCFFPIGFHKRSVGLDQ